MHTGGVDVVVARHDRNVLGISERLQPGESGFVLARKADVGEVAGNCDMIRLLGHRIDGDGIGEQSLVHRAALALPIQIAKSALQVPIARVETGYGSEVQVGDVGKGDGIGHAVPEFERGDRGAW